MVLWAGALLLLGLLTALPGGTPVSQAGNDSWTTETSVNPSDDNYLYGVAAPDTDVAWAVGYYKANSFGAPSFPLIELWNGSSWATVTPIPTTGSVSAQLYGTAAFGTSNGWAVGETNAAFANPRPYAVHTTDGGATWSIPATPVNPNTTGRRFQGVGGVADNDVWAVGYEQNGANTPVPEIQHWNGSGWNRSYSISGASNGVLYGVAADDADNAWAVGYEPDGSNIHRVLVAQWDGSGWAQDTSAAFSIPNSSTDESLQSVTFLPNGDVMAVGYYYSSLTSSYQTVAFYYDVSNPGWTRQTPPNVNTLGDQLFGVAAVGDTYVWAVGHEADAASCCTLTARWNGSSWSHVSSPNLADAGNFLKAVAVGPDLGCGSHDTWAVGYYLSSNDPQTLIMRYTTPTICSP
jgi:hypothetical protein